MKDNCHLSGSVMCVCFFLGILFITKECPKGGMYDFQNEAFLRCVQGECVFIIIRALTYTWASASLA